MNKRAPSKDSLKHASLAMAELMPQIIRGAQLDFFAKSGVTQTQFLVLAAIFAYGEATMVQLARSLHVSMPTMTGIVERLASATYVKRETKPTDRRQIVIELTSKGIHFIKQFQLLVSKRWSEVLKVLRPHELNAFHRVVAKLHGELKRT